jgi:hypothetical protein
LPTWLRFDSDTAICALFRALPSAGSRIEMSKAMIAITTSNSISVKPERRFAPERPRMLFMFRTSIDRPAFDRATAPVCRL